MYSSKDENLKFRLFFAITHAVVAGLFLSVVVTAQATQLERSGPTIRIIKPASQAMEIKGSQSAANLECTDSVITTTDSTIYMPIILNNYKLSLLYFDDFSDPNSGWYSGDASGCTVGYVNEQYQIIVWDPDDGLVITPDLNLPNDYRIEVDAYQASTNEGSYGLMFGIQWGVDTYEGYQIVVYPTTQDY